MNSIGMDHKLKFTDFNVKIYTPLPPPPPKKKAILFWQEFNLQRERNLYSEMTLSLFIIHNEQTKK
jgi:hypothetical protein